MTGVPGFGADLREADILGSPASASGRRRFHRRRSCCGGLPPAELVTKLTIY